MNWNDEAVVFLNDLGHRVLRQHYADLGLTHAYPPSGLEGDRLKAELWSVANIFGKHLCHGGELPFRDTTIELSSRAANPAPSRAAHTPGPLSKHHEPGDSPEVWRVRDAKGTAVAHFLGRRQKGEAEANADLFIAAEEVRRERDELANEIERLKTRLGVPDAEPSASTHERPAHTPSPWRFRAGMIEAPGAPYKCVATLPFSAIRAGKVSAAEVQANGELLARAPELLAEIEAHVRIINAIAERLGLPEGSSDEDAEDAIASLQADLVSEETISRGWKSNCVRAERQRDALAEALEAVERKLRTLRGRTSREEVWLECEDLEPLHEQVLAALRAAAGGL